MDEHAARKILEGGGGVLGAAARAALWAPGKCYGAAMRARRAAYRRGWFASEKADVPVVSIGNLTAGGSGKTPMTAFLARELAARGWTVGILLRGYRQEGGVSDEGALYRELAPEAIVEVNPNRREGAKAAAAKGANVILLDDGMQHLKLRRDVDIVLVDATSPWGGGNTIPGGLLREGKSTLAVADAVVLTRSDQVKPETIAALRDEVSALAPDTPTFTARHAPARLRLLTGKSLPLETLAGKKVVALSGIARPEAFQQTLRQMGAEVVAGMAGADHADFDETFVNVALGRAAKAGAMVVITEKDRNRRIFSHTSNETADKNCADDNNNVYGSIVVLGVDQSVDGGERLLEAVIGKIAAAADGQ